MNRIRIYSQLYSQCLILTLALFILGACATGSPTSSEGDASLTSEQEAEVVSAQPVQSMGGSCSIEGLSATITDEETISALLAAEGQMIVVQDIDRLMRLWSSESRIVDAKNTPENADDDQLWIDKDAIRHRYVRTVFPGAPSAIQPADIDIELDGEQATARSTTQIGTEVSPSGDRWDLIQLDGCWYIKGLTYNLEVLGQ